MKKFFYTLMFAFTLFASAASADYLDTVGAPTVAPSTSAASAPVADSQKPTVAPVLKCTKSYGSVAIEEQPATAEQNQTFTQVGFTPVLVIPLARHAVPLSGCFSLPERGAAKRAPWVLKVSVQNPVTTTEVSAGTQMGRGFLTYLGVSNHAPDPVVLVSTQVTLTVVDAETGEPVATVIGEGNRNDAAVGARLMENSKGVLANASNQTPATQAVAAGFVDAINKLVPLLAAASPAK